MLAIIGIFELVLLLPLLAVGVLGTIFWFWMLIECATKEPSTGNEKVVWVIIIALTHLVGAAIYFFVRRPQRIAQCGS